MVDLSLFSEYGFELSSEEEALFSRFLTLFLEYNSHTNLSAIRDEAGIIEKHFVDSLFGAAAIELSGRVLDIGSGGGFPGIPLKIIQSELQVTLLDSVGKKVKAMNHFVEELGLSGIQAIQERAEVLAKDPEHTGKYDFVVSRATAYITDILAWAVPFLKPDGKILLYKMPSDEEKQDRAKAMKKYGLVLDGELSYTLGGKERIIYVFARK